MKSLRKVEFIVGVAVILFASLGMYFSDTHLDGTKCSCAEACRTQCNLHAPAEVESPQADSEPTPAKNEPTLAPVKFFPPERGHVVCVQVEVGE